MDDPDGLALDFMRPSYRTAATEENVTIWRAVCTNEECAIWLPDHRKSMTDESAPAFCPQCGAGVLDHCPNPHCGKELPRQNAKATPFCGECGQQLRFKPDASTGKVTVIVDGD